MCAALTGKNAALQIDAWVRQQAVPKFDPPRKSRHRVAGYDELPVPIAADFFGRTLISPFLLSAAPPRPGRSARSAVRPRSSGLSSTPASS